MIDKKRVRIGVLALQGAFYLHKRHLEAMDVEYVEVVSRDDFQNIDALILPGGESSTMLKLIDTLGIQEELMNCFRSKPVWGICAGAILMAKQVTHPSQKSFGVIDIEISRNAYGRQLESVEEMVNDFRVSYIRAPKISRVGVGVDIRSKRGDDPSWVESGRKMVTTFHPETSMVVPSPWHKQLVHWVGK